MEKRKLDSKFSTTTPEVIFRSGEKEQWMTNAILDATVLQIRQSYLLYSLPCLELFVYAAASLWVDPLGYRAS